MAKWTACVRGRISQKDTNNVYTDELYETHCIRFASWQIRT